MFGRYPAKTKADCLAATIIVAGLLATGCGGGSQSANTADAAARTQRALEKSAYPGSVTMRGSVAAKAAPSGSIAADAHLKGMWSEVGDWPLIALHAVLLPDGRVMSYGTQADGKQTAKFIYDVWTPSAGFAPESHLTLANTTQTDLFCSSQLVLPQRDTGVFMAGGDTYGEVTANNGNNNSNLFSYGANTLTRGDNMNRVRYYATPTTLLNGETYIQGGDGGTDRPEIRSIDGKFRLLSGADTSALHFNYPKNFIAPDGRLFGYDITGKMYYVNTTGDGSLSNVGQIESTYNTLTATAAMFRPGRILQFGGLSNRATVIDINASDGTPRLTETQPLSSQRRHATATILPDGRVLATGGSAVTNQLIEVNNSAEVWDPVTGAWTQGASGALARLYHSTALLLPDATVLVAGGGAPGPLTNLNAEIYYPPYLFRDGALAARPRIVTAPSQLRVGASFALDFADTSAISRVTLLKTGSVTHNFNMEQRFVDLPYTAAGQQLTVQMPARAADVPPGYYLLFVIDADGVPSEAKIVWINVAGAPDPGNAPVVTNPGAQQTVVETAVALAVQASDADSDVLSFFATGLPSGLSIDTATGVVSGTADRAGAYDVAISASDGALSGSVNFTWSVTSPETLGIDPLPPRGAALAGTDVSYSATAHGVGARRYKWNFGDGTAETPYAASGTITHRYTSPGVFFVTVTATDTSGLETRQTFMQIIHLPLSAKRPTASSTIAYEARNGFPPRVWAVNPDGDKVSAFKPATRTREREIAVGVSPRALAVDKNNRIWVTNKHTATISVIDPFTLGIKTIALRRASQPHGIAMNPIGDFAFVALEATGEVLKFRTSDYFLMTTTPVGPQPRHVAVSADGATVYVSRFVTPPQPGESTAAVETAANGLPSGGEVVRLKASDLSVVGTVTLGFSTTPDNENGGRGVPNYLAVAVLSPDATQAWVPSKLDNIQRGVLRNGVDLSFQNTVRAVSSRIDLATGAEDPGARIDHDNASLASAAAFDPLGVFLFVALETSREVAVIDAHAHHELFRFDVGRAPQGLAVSPDGTTLHVSNYMDRTLGFYDLRPLLQQGQLRVDLLASTALSAVEKLTPQVLFGKQLFHDARDTRLAREGYMSCASCHADGGQDGRVWDLSGFGEGLRNTVALRGRAGAQGLLHWSNNFDEVQDFENQIRALAGGSGLMSDADFLTGTRSEPLGAPKKGVSAELDALAAYLGSLSVFDSSPYRVSDTALGAPATAGKALFNSRGCGSCHAGSAYTGSGRNTLLDIGTLKPTSGTRLGAPLSGIDVPTLRDVWATAPYLHDGSAATLGEAIRAHREVSISDADLTNLVVYVQSIGREEAAPAVPAGGGIGLRGEYFNNMTLAPPVILTRNEAVDFSWLFTPGGTVSGDRFSVRWSGSVLAPASGSYQFQTVSNDGVRLWVDGVLLIDNWNVRTAALTETSPQITLLAGRPYRVVMEFFDSTGGAEARLRWQTPGNLGFGVVPKDRLLPN